jgi:glutaminase
MRSPVTDYLQTIYDRHLDERSGELADYIPELATAEPDLFGISMVTTEGAVYDVGDTHDKFTIQSISKPLTFGLALDELGEEQVRKHIGVEPTGDAFNSITLSPETGTPLNPMVNAGAIAAVGILDAARGEARLDRIIKNYSAYAGRPLTIDDAVRAGESSTGDRNRAISHLLKSSGAITDDPHEVVEDYFAQCSALVDCRDLAMIAATLANGGINPRTGVRAASQKTVRKVLSVMMSCGMYNHAGQWLYTVGLPAKSGVAGGIIAVLPGQLGIGVFSPRLDDAGNSVRGVRVCEDITRELDLHPIQPGKKPPSPVHTRFRLNELRSKRWRAPERIELLQQIGRSGAAFELQGDIDFGAAEQATRAVIGADVRCVVLDLHRVTHITNEAVSMLIDLVDVMQEDERRVIFSRGVHLHEQFDHFKDQPIEMVSDFDVALEYCEDELIGEHGVEPEPHAIELEDHLLLSGLDKNQFERIKSVMEFREIGAGEHVFRAGDPSDEIYLVTRGRVSGYYEISPGERRRLVTLGPGGLLGDIAFVMNQPRVADMKVDADVECWVFTRDMMGMLRDEDPRMQATLLANLLNTVAMHSKQISDEVRMLIG